MENGWRAESTDARYATGARKGHDPVEIVSGVKMPVLFVGHGSPTNAIEDNEFSRAWADAGKVIPRPRAVLCVSAHWETNGTLVTASDRPGTIHDFRISSAAIRGELPRLRCAGIGASGPGNRTGDEGAARS